MLASSLAPSPRSYKRREPEHSVLYAVLQAELETFLAQAQLEHDRVPAFVERELRGFLRCGILAHGFVRVHCDGCGHDRLVAFSCKGRGFCPSCGGKRMTRFAEHSIDHVLPVAPVRQWVLTVPHRLRYRIAYDHALCLEVHRAFIRALLASYRRRARELGAPLGHTGTITCIQRFGSALNLNPHFHTQAIDGVFCERSDGSLAFHPLPPPTHDEALDVLHDFLARLQPVLKRRGLLDAEEDDADPLTTEAPVLAAVYAGSVEGRAALGERRGRAPSAVGRDALARWVDKPLRHHAELEGFDLHAAVSIPARARDRLEQLLRYCARPAISHPRLTLASNGRVLLALKTPRFDGTTHLALSPHELIERLVALIPRPNKNLILYGGVLAPNAKLRKRITQYGRNAAAGARTAAPARAHDTAQAAAEIAGCLPTTKPAYNSEWARLMRRAFDLDVLKCPSCSGRMRVLALIESPQIARRILRHLSLRDHAPPIAPARALPDPFDDVA